MAAGGPRRATRRQRGPLAEKQAEELIQTRGELGQGASPVQQSDDRTQQIAEKVPGARLRHDV